MEQRRQDIQAATPQLHYYDMGVGVTAFSSTRRGGYSTGAWGEFNINRYCGDSDEAIGKNRAALCQLLDISDDCLLMPHQTHETHVARIDSGFLAHPTPLEGFDALMTDLTGICIGVSTADCIPLLLYDEEHRAVCAIHAGWRGTLRRIAQHAVSAMCQAYGSHPQRLKAQTGPGISLESFEVGDEVYEAFEQADFDMQRIAFKRNGKWHIDLWQANALDLQLMGIPEKHIEIAGVCTYQYYDQFFSARRLGIKSGRIYTGIMIK